MEKESTLLENLLVTWRVALKGTTQKLRAFSHVATTPADVSDWAPVDLDMLGEPVLVDIRSCAAMQDRDVSFHRVAQLHGIMVRPLILHTARDAQ
jgi:hypothetical protein